MIKIDPVFQTYDWGSTENLQEIFPNAPKGRVAEAWFGTHLSAPSLIDTGKKNSNSNLADYIAENPIKHLGNFVAENFENKLPFLLKVLGIDKCLSLQVHPSEEQAREGFRRKLIDDYKDGNPKPEMLVALTKSYAFNGVKSPSKILGNLEGLKGRLIEKSYSTINNNKTEEGVKNAYKAILNSKDKMESETELEKTLDSIAERYDKDQSPSLVNDGMVLMAADDHEGDVTVLNLLFLNGVKLDKFDSCDVPSNRVHAYLRGCGVEIMCNSDNVFRGGLTSKNINEEHFFKLTSFKPINQFHAESTIDARGIHNYEPGNPYFGLYCGELENNSAELYPEGPRILVVLDGEFTVITKSNTAEGDDDAIETTSDSETSTVKKGDAYFISDSDLNVTIRGKGEFCLGYVPSFSLDEDEIENFILD
jgi:mannose-6-phosphate isomerase